MVLIRHPHEYVVVDEAVQPVGEDVARDPEAGLEVIEAGHAQEGVPNDEQAPPFPDDLEALGHRAVDVLETGSLHAPSLPGCVMERTSLRVARAPAGGPATRARPRQGRLVRGHPPALPARRPRAVPAGRDARRPPAGPPRRWRRQARGSVAPGLPHSA